MATKPLYGIYCTGGGAQGAYQVGVLKYIYENFCVDNRSPFQVFAGSSIGSINTTYCGSLSYDAQLSSQRLEELWLGFDIPDWHRNLFYTAMRSVYRRYTTPRSKRQITWSLLNPKPLQDIVETSIKRENIQKALECKTTRGMAISATEILSGKTVWFHEGPSIDEWNFLRSHSRNVELRTEHIQASCSAPFLFPPVKVGDHYFVDGSMSVKTPFNPMVNMGATKILCIASERPFPNVLPKYYPRFRPKLYHLYRMFEGQISYNYSIEQAGTIKFINYFSEKLRGPGRVQQTAEAPHIFSDNGVYPENYQTTDVFMFFPSQRIRQSTVYPIGDSLNMNRKTQFMFKKEYTQKLIELGYMDARVKHDQLREFFYPTSESFISRFFHHRKKKKSFDPTEEA